MNINLQELKDLKDDLTDQFENSYNKSENIKFEFSRLDVQGKGLVKMEFWFQY